MGNRESEQEPLTASAAAEANMCCIIFSVTVACATVVGFTCRQHSERNRACRSSPVVADLAGLGSGCRANLEGFESGHSGTNRGDNPSPPEPQPDLSATPLWRIPAICTGSSSRLRIIYSLFRP